VPPKKKASITDTGAPVVTRTTPYAAMIIWNYKTRIGSDSTGKTSLNDVDSLYINSLSCVALHTSKSKSDPQGTFSAVLAPTRNWVAAITPGSWACILMSDKPILPSDLITLDFEKLKMFGKIDTVRLDTLMGEDGTRTTAYYVSGMDWGHVFHSTLYIDPDQVNNNEPSGLKGGLADALQQLLFKKGVPQLFNTKFNLTSILQIFGKKLYGEVQTSSEALVGYKIQSVYSVHIPSAVATYLKLHNGSGTTIAADVNSALTLITGILTPDSQYKESEPALGIVNLNDFLGTHSFWELLRGNACDLLSEMYAEMNPTKGRTQLVLYNRIKPFALKGTAIAAKVPPILRSYFQNIKTHAVSPSIVLSINAGTNWADKYNFIEIKSTWTDGTIQDASDKKSLQSADSVAWNREGFRAMIVPTKFFPGKVTSTKGKDGKELIKAEMVWADFAKWVSAMKSWYFDTHKMLNGTIQLIGTNQYYAVGNNIKIDADILNPVHTWGAKDKSTPNHFLLAHIESVQNSFTISPEGAKQYRTTISFVRGVITDNKGNVLQNDKAGALGPHNLNIRNAQWRNDSGGNVYSSSTSDDPDRK